MRKAEKPFFVQNLTQELKSASSIVLVDYSGMNVKMQQQLKKKLREVGAEMMVVKNTLFRLAARNAKLQEDIVSDNVLTGPIALIVTEADPIAPIQVLGKFVQEHQIPNLKIGVVEGRLQDQNSLIAISKLPTHEALLGQFLGTVAQPMFGLVFTLQANLQKLVWVLKSKSSS